MPEKMLHFCLGSPDSDVRYFSVNNLPASSDHQPTATPALSD
jgi:hypothetical protein